MKISPKLFLLFVGISAIPLATVAGVVLFQTDRLEEDLLSEQRNTATQTTNVSRDALEAQAKTTLLVMVQEKASLLENFFGDVQWSAQLQASLVEQALRSPKGEKLYPMQLSGEISEQLKDQSSHFAQKVHGKKPYVLYHIPSGVNKNSVQGILERMRYLGSFYAHNQARLPWCVSTYTGHKSGLIVGYPGRSKIPPTYDPRKRPWYKKVNAKKSVIWTNVYKDRNKKDLVISCAAPVWNAKHNEIVAVSAIDVNLNEIVTKLFDLRKLPVDEAFLLNHNGEVEINKANNSTNKEKTHINDYREGIFQIVFSKIKENPLISSHVFVHAHEGSKNESIFAYARIAMGNDQTQASNDFFYVAKMKKDTILGPVRSTQKILDQSNKKFSSTLKDRSRFLAVSILGILFSVLCIALAIAYFTARSFTKPVVKLSKITQRIGEGDLDQQVDIKTKDEIGELGSAIEKMIKGLKERDFVKSTFKRYVTASVVEHLISSPDKVRLGGEKHQLTVFFSDLTGFTTISEELSPEALVALINDYLSAMTDSIFKQEGTLDKYIGDAIMAFWGAPIAQEDHATRACIAALDNFVALRRLWNRWESNNVPLLSMRIGINTGDMVVGNMGSKEIMGYTVMGDAVNLGARLEGANKIYGTHILISESTRRAAGDTIVVREVDSLAVKGKKKPVEVYELLGVPGQIEDSRIKGYEFFSEGLAAYRNRQWDTATKAFNGTLEIIKDDPVSKVFLTRIDQFRAAPPPESWNGVFHSSTK